MMIIMIMLSMMIKIVQYPTTENTITIMAKV